MLKEGREVGKEEEKKEGRIKRGGRSGRGVFIFVETGLNYRYLLFSGLSRRIWVF